MPTVSLQDRASPATRHFRRVVECSVADDPPTRALTAYRIALAVALAVGVAVRVRQWWHGRSFWLDEVYVVQNLDRLDGRALLGPLSNFQVAPHGWLWLVDETNRGDLAGEQWLRLLPLLFGCATLLAVAGLATQLFRSRWAVLAAVALAALVPALVYYSDEVKQYSADAAVVAGLMLLTLLAVRDPRADRLALWAGGVTVGVWLSTAAILVAPALGALLLAAVIRHGRRLVLMFLAFAAAAAVSVAAEAWLVKRRTDANPTLDQFWAEAYPSGGALGYVGWLGHTVADYVRDPLGLGPGPLIAILAAAGLVTLVRQQGWLITAVVAAPPLCALGAGALHVYPPTGRLLLYTVPSTIILLAAAVAGAVALRRRWLVPVAVALVLATAAGAAGQAVDRWRHPTEVEEVATAFGYVAAHRRPADVVAVPQQARPFASVYGPRHGVPVRAALTLTPPHPACLAGHIAAKRSMPRAGRVWVIGGRRQSHLAVNPADGIAAGLAAHGRVIEIRRWFNASAVLIDLDQPPAGRSSLPAAAVAEAARSCLDMRPV